MIKSEFIVNPPGSLSTSWLGDVIRWAGRNPKGEQCDSSFVPRDVSGKGADAAATEEQNEGNK